jgi:hypothetical protein
VRRLAVAEVPQTSVTTEPSWLRSIEQLPETLEPSSIEVLGLVEVDVQEVIGGGQAGIQPSLGLGVESLEDLRPQL